MTPRTKVTLTAKMQSPKGNVSTKQNQLKNPLDTTINT